MDKCDFSYYLKPWSASPRVDAELVPYIILQSIRSIHQNYNQLDAFKVELHLGRSVLFLLSLPQRSDGVHQNRVLSGLQPKVVCTWSMRTFLDWLPIGRNAYFPITPSFDLRRRMWYDSEVVVRGWKVGERGDLSQRRRGLYIEFPLGISRQGWMGHV